jgi:hypothetical protein
MGHAADGICSYSNPVLRSGPDSGPPNNEQLYTKLGVHFATSKPVINWVALVANSVDLNSVSTTIPKSIPAGEYLLRVEHIGLHVAGKPQVGSRAAFGCTRLTFWYSSTRRALSSESLAKDQVRHLPRSRSRAPTRPRRLRSLPIFGRARMSGSICSGSCNHYTNRKPYPMPGPPAWKG